MKWNRETELRASRVTHAVLGVVALLGLLVLIRELPALRRYLRMGRM
jgi:hypothetical protein